MKNVMKRTVSAIVAVLTVAVTAVSAYAADYAHAPSFSDSPSESTSVTTGTISNAIDDAVSGALNGVTDTDASEGDTAGDKDSSESGKTVATVTAESNKNVRISATVIRQLAQKEDTVLNIVTPKAEFSIDSEDISKARNVNLSSTIENNKRSTTLNFSSKRDFGVAVRVTVTSCKLSKSRLAKAHVYCNGEDLGPVEIDENGNPVITVTKGGKYVIR